MNPLLLSIALFVCGTQLTWAQDADISCQDLISNFVANGNQLFILSTRFENLAPFLGLTVKSCTSPRGTVEFYHCQADEVPTLIPAGLRSLVDLEFPVVDLSELDIAVLCTPRPDPVPSEAPPTDVVPCAGSGYVDSLSDFSPSARNVEGVVCPRRCSFGVRSQGGSIGTRIRTKYACCEGERVGSKGRYTCSTDAPETSPPKPITSPPKPVTSAPRPATSAPRPVTSASRPVTSAPRPATSAPRPVTNPPGLVPDPPAPSTNAPPSPGGLVSCSNLPTGTSYNLSSFAVRSRQYVCERHCSFGVSTFRASFGSQRTRTYRECCYGAVPSRGRSIACAGPPN